MQALGADCGQETYVIDQRIGCDVVIAGQVGQSQALAALVCGRSRTWLLRGHPDRH